MLNRPVTIASAGRRREAETVIMQNIAHVLHHNELTLWEHDSIESLFHFLLINRVEGYSERHCHRLLNKLQVVDFEQVARSINTEKKLLKNKDLKPRELAAKNALNYGSNIMAKRISGANKTRMSKRKITIGESVDADGWTDAISFIAINRKNLSALDKGRSGAFELAILMLHEYCHTPDNPDPVDHGFSFYERFHDLSSTQGRYEILGHTADSIYKQYCAQLVNKQETLPRAVFRDFKYPIINEQIIIKCELTPKGLSKFVELVLTVSKVTYKKTKTRLTLSYPYTKTDAIRKRLYTYLNNTLLPDVNMDDLDKFNHIENFQERVQAKNIHLKKACTLWATKQGYDIAAVSHLFNGSNSLRLNLDFIAETLVKDSHSGVIQYTIDSLHTIKILGGPQYHYKDLSPSVYHGHTPDGYERDIVNNMKSSSTSRHKFAMARLKQLILSVTDKDERNNLLDVLSNDDFLSTLRL